MRNKIQNSEVFVVLLSSYSPNCACSLRFCQTFILAKDTQPFGFMISYMFYLKCWIFENSLMRLEMWCWRWGSLKRCETYRRGSQRRWALVCSFWSFCCFVFIISKQALHGKAEVFGFISLLPQRLSGAFWQLIHLKSAKRTLLGRRWVGKQVLWSQGQLVWGSFTTPKK